MRRVRVLVTSVVLLVGATVTGMTTAGARPAGSAAVPGLPVYLALGDSVAAGVGSAPDPKDWRSNGYVAQFADILAEDLDCLPARWWGARGGCDHVQTVDLAEGGATTTSLIAEQLPVAVRILERRNGDENPRNDVEVISLTIGGNDVFQPLVAACIVASPPVTCEATVAAVLDQVAAGYDRILSTLREAAGDETVILPMTYYNPLPFCVIGAVYPHAGPVADLVLEGGSLDGFGTVPVGLNDVIRAAAARYGATVADTYGPLLGEEDFVGGHDCLHPDGSGHTKIATVFGAAFNAR